jgi:hypothetical protein
LSKERWPEAALQKRTLFLVTALLLAGMACSDSVSPEDQSLEGPWSTGHLIFGLGMALNLTWTDGDVSGSGGYAAFESGAPCGTATITGSGTAVLTATRPSSRDIRGQMTFGTGPRFQFQGTLTIDPQQPGFASIDGMLISADGSQCALPLRQGLIP